MANLCARRRLSFLLALRALLGLTAAAGCQQLGEYKAQWHAGQEAPATGSLSVEVEPREGVTIWLDGERAATASPYARAGLRVGSHVLEVRAMGYHSVTLPIRIDASHPLRLPVRLRPRPPANFAALPAEGASEGATSSQAAQQPRTPPGEAAPALAPEPADGQAPRAGRRSLPDQPRLLRLSVQARPAAAIVVDGVAADADDVRLLQGEGLLNIGEMALRYHIRPGRVLELSIPHEASRGTGWYVGALQVKAKSLVRLSASPVVLRRLAPGRRAEATLQRID